MAMRIVNWLFIAILITAAFILGCVLRQANAQDPFIARLEMLLGVRPGQLLPVDTRAPDIRLEYEGAKAASYGCYEVKVCRAR